MKDFLKYTLATIVGILLKDGNRSVKDVNDVLPCNFGFGR